MKKSGRESCEVEAKISLQSLSKTRNIDSKGQKDYKQPKKDLINQYNQYNQDN